VFYLGVKVLSFEVIGFCDFIVLETGKRCIFSENLLRVLYFPFFCQKVFPQLLTAFPINRCLLTTLENDSLEISSFTFITQTLAQNVFLG
jgi:hypothetical protein